MTDPMELVALVEARIGQEFDSECHLTEDEARLITACIREMVEWRPIETAPDLPLMAAVAFFGPAHDVLSALERGRDERYELAWFDGMDWRESGTAHLYDEREPEHRPTHWLPLPPAPGAEA